MNKEPTPYRLCSKYNCDAKHYGLGLCRKHYRTSEHGRRLINAYKKDYFSRGRGLEKRKEMNERRKNDPVWRLKKNAKNAAQYAIAKGTLTRLPCEKCGRKSEAHHDSYEKEKWLSVRWLCPVHHKEWHMNNSPALPSYIL